MRKISGLKKFFSYEYSREFITYLRDGFLGRFFYGLGRDELKELIETKSEYGADEV